MRKWLVTVEGYDADYGNPYTGTTLVIELPKDKTPVDWFLEKPNVYFRFNFTPNKLINFWKIG